MLAINAPVSGLTWISELGLPLVTVVANRRPSGWKAIPVKPVPATGVPTSVPVPLAWLIVTSAPRFNVPLPLLPYIVKDGVQLGVPVGVTVGVGVGLGHTRVYRTFNPGVSVAMPQEKVLAGPVLLACTPLVSSRPLSVVTA